MWIMIAGPYRSGSKDPEVWQKNLDEMNNVALQVFELGHTPIIGVNMALPICHVADISKYDELMMPISLRLTEKCDAILRIGGPSKGADLEVEKFRQKDLPIFSNIDQIPIT